LYNKLDDQEGSYYLNAGNINAGILSSTYGGTGNGWTKFIGPTTAEKTFTLPDSSQTLLYSGGALGTPASGTLTNCTFPTLNQSTSGTAAGLSSTLVVGSGGTGTATAFTLGSVVFATTAGTYAQDNSNFFYDGTNHRLGLGTSAPSTVLDVNGISRFGNHTTNYAQIDTAGVLSFSGSGALQNDIDQGIYGFMPIVETTIAFNDTTYVFTLGVTGTTFSYYRSGIKYTITGAKTITLSGTPPTTNKYYIYIDSTNGTLIADNTEWNLADTKVPVAMVNFNNTLTPKYILCDERHPCDMSRGYHRAHHFTEGTQISVVPTITSLVVSTDTLVAKRPTLSSGALYDESLLISNAALAPTGSPYTATDYRMIYRTSSSTWTWIPSSMVFPYNGSTNFIQYDVNGTLTDGRANRWYNSYLVQSDAVNDNFQYTFIPGRAEFTSLALAQAEDPTTFTMTGFPILEFAIATQLTWSTNAGPTTTGKCTWVASRQVKSGNVITGYTSVVLAPSATTDTTNATNIDSGILSTAVGGTGTATTFTAGSLVFAGVSGVYSQDNTNLFWDNTNKRLGLGTSSTVSARLHSIATTEQLRLGYDTSNYWSATVGSTGALALTGTGTNSTLTITPISSQNLNVVLGSTGKLLAGSSSQFQVTATGAVTALSYNAITPTAIATGFTLAGGTTSKTLTVSNSLTLAGTDNSTLNIGTGGTLNTGAFSQTPLLNFTTVTTTAVSKSIANGEFCNVTAATQTITLPTSPTVGMVIAVQVGNFIDTVIGRNSQLIMSLAEDLTINEINSRIVLIFVGGTIGWLIVDGESPLVNAPNVLSLALTNLWTKAQRTQDVALTSTAGHIAIDFAYESFYHTTTEDTILDFPTNLPSSNQTQSCVFKITQGATPRAMAFASGYTFLDGYYSLTQTGGAINTITMLVVSPSLIYCWMV
jgi:hypothetical protein